MGESVGTKPAASPDRDFGLPVMRQRWRDLVFLHWPVEASALRPLLPRLLEPESRDGAAWITATPFRVSGMRPLLFPPLPLVGAALELNLRTYVRYRACSGVWFFGLDSTNPLAVAAARIAFRLPFNFATARYERTGNAQRFESRRRRLGPRPASFAARWTVGDACSTSAPGSLEAFLVERYCLLTGDASRLWSATIAHEPWSLCPAHVHEVAGTLFAAHGLPVQGLPALAHAQRLPLDVAAWPLQRLA